MGLHRLIGMRIGVPAPDSLAAFYGELGLASDDGSSFAGTDGGAQVTVDEHPFRRLLEVEIGAADERDLYVVAGRLTGLGLDAAIDDGSVSVIDPVTQVTFRVRVVDPIEQTPSPDTPVENRPADAPRRNRRADGVFQTARPPRRLGHLVIGCPDLAATQRLLVDGIGCKVSDEFPGVISFLRCSTDHHNIGLVGSPVPILQHYSWECDDVDHVGHSATKLLRADADRQAWGFGRHHVGSNYYWYLHDSAGAFLELYSDMDVIDDDEAWESSGRTPVGFEHVANSWGPAIPTEFIVPSDLDHLQSAWASRG